MTARLCLIEDDEIMGGALSMRFELEGFACDWFKTGKSALAAFGKNALSGRGQRHPVAGHHR
jgi:DNA-binding response OmpR family regulator